MDFANRGNKQAQPQQAQAPASNDQPAPQTFQPATNNTKKKSGGGFDFGKFSTVFLLFAGAFLILAVIFGLVFGDATGNKESDAIQDDKYQAIFLDSADGQVYFGKMGVFNDNMYILTDIYYVRVENPIQPQGEVAQQPNISLAKLGNELHGPQDVMYIRRDKVLYWENLKDDGQVVTAITEFKANGGQTQQTPAPAPAPTPAPAEDTSGTQPTGTEETDDTAAPEETPTTP